MKNISTFSLALAFAFAFKADAATSPPSGPVTVVNTTANPVPVVQQGTTSVSVVNTTANPVPVVQQGTTSISGNVTINGTPNVNVANTPSVNVANTPSVVLSPGATVRVAEAPYAWQITVHLDIAENDCQPLAFGECDTSGQTHPSELVAIVPDLKRFVIEHISYDGFTRSDSASSQRVVQIAILTTVYQSAHGGDTPITASHVLSPPIYQGKVPINSVLNSYFELFSGSQVTRLYADPNTEVRVATLIGKGPIWLRNFTVSGYLVDSPDAKNPGDGGGPVAGP